MRATGIIVLAATIAAAKEFVPARRLDGQLPLMPGPSAVGWLEEAADLAVDENGSVSGVTLLRGNTPVAKLLDSAASTWRFQRATYDDKPVKSNVLAVAVVRPPQLYDQPTTGSPATDLAGPPDDMPYPTVMRRPRYPPRALGDGMVLVEVLVDVDGRVRSAGIVSGARGFNEEALLTARAWTFRPARRAGTPMRAYAYLVFGFRQPVV